MSFEMMLAQLMTLPMKFLIADCLQIYEKHKDDPERYAAEKIISVKNLDRELKAVMIPRILLDRLKKEFDDSHSLSTQFGKSKQIIN
jgi:hypothetical protein